MEFHNCSTADGSCSCITWGVVDILESLEAEIVTGAVGEVCTPAEFGIDGATLWDEVLLTNTAVCGPDAEPENAGPAVGAG